MILYNNNKVLVNERDTQITNTIFFNDTSVKLFDSMTFYVVLPTNSTVIASLSNVSGNVFIYDSNNADLTRRNTFTLTSAVQSGYYVSVFSVAFGPELEQLDCACTLSIRIGNKTHNVHLAGYGVEADASLLEKLQNFNVRFTEDYVTAMKASNHNEQEPDEKLLNDKRKEYLYDLLHLAGYSGTYANIDAALTFFGWNEILTLREIWYNSSTDKYAYTEFGSDTQSSINQRLSGYVKTNRLQLIYQINELERDVDGNVVNDEDGLEFYVSVNSDFTELSIKLYALMRVLDQDFFTFNAQIDEIIGEYTLVTGNSSTVRLNDASTLNEWMNDQQRITVTPTYELLDDDNNGIITVRNHSVVLLETLNSFNEDQTELSKTYRPTTENILEIVADTDDVDIRNDDLLQHLHEHDLALLKAHVDFDTDWYNRFKFVVLDSATKVEVYHGKLRPIEDVTEYAHNFYLGFTELGEYDVMLYLFDNWGGVEIIDISKNLNVTDGLLDFKLAKQDHISNTRFRALSSISTWRTIDGQPVYNPFDQTLDINADSNAADIIRRYASEASLYPTSHSILRLSGIAATKLTGRVLSDFGYAYATYIIDIIDQGAIGNKTLQLRLFEHNDYDNITVYYDGGDKYKFIQTIVSTINAASDDSEFSNFTASLDKYSIDGSTINVKPVLRLTSKLPGLTVEKIDIPNYVISAVDAQFYLPLAATQFVYMSQTAVGTLTVQSGDKIKTITDFDATNIDDINNELTSIFDELNIHANVHSSTTLSTSMCIVTSMDELYISHTSIGTIYDIPRGVLSAYLKDAYPGDEYGLAEPIYAYVDDRGKYAFTDIEWELRNTLTDQVITTQKAYTFRYMLFESGSYDLTMKVSNVFGSAEHTKYGCILVR